MQAMYLVIVIKNALPLSYTPKLFKNPFVGIIGFEPMTLDPKNQNLL